MAPRRALLEQKKQDFALLGVIAPPPIHIQTPAFDGSLAMLFRCVRETKVDLLDVPLLPICEAYFHYLVDSSLSKLDEVAAALTALAYLLERKAWLLLPTPEIEPEDEDVLELPTPTAHEYRLAIESLELWKSDRDRWFFRSPETSPDPYELPYVLAHVTASDLALAFQRLLNRADLTSIESPSKPRKSLAEQMASLLRRVDAHWRRLDHLFDEFRTRSEAVYDFLALLELIRLGQISIRLVSAGNGELEVSRAGTA
jgi:chromatin segregation and condensation protein Rec8/ScpA/Scc1 (kleisin family)